MVSAFLSYVLGSAAIASLHFCHLFNRQIKVNQKLSMYTAEHSVILTAYDARRRRLVLSPEMEYI